MNARDCTVCFLCLLPLVMGLWSLAMYCCVGNDATLSKVMLDAAREYPGFLLVVAFALGVLAGHWFVPIVVVVTVETPPK